MKEVPLLVFRRLTLRFFEKGSESLEEGAEWREPPLLFNATPSSIDTVVGRPCISDATISSKEKVLLPRDVAVRLRERGEDPMRPSCLSADTRRHYTCVWGK